MKQVFGGILIGLVALTGIVMTFVPSGDLGDRTGLTWVSDDNPARREQISLFNELHPRYKLRLDPASTGLHKLVVQCIAGVGPDLFDATDGFSLSAFVRAGIAWDLTHVLEEAGIDVKRDCWPGSFTTAIYEGRTYGFPRNTGTDALLYNKVLLRKMGIDSIPRRIGCEEFLDLARKLTVRGKDGRPEHFGFLFVWWQWPHFLRQWGGHVYSADGTRCTLAEPEAIAAFTFMRDLIWEYKVSPTPQQEDAMAATGGWGSGTITLFGGGRGAMALAGRWWLCTLRNRKNYPNLELGVAECQFGTQRLYRGYCGVVLVNRKSPRREHAVEFLKYMASEPYNRLINHQADALGPTKKFAYAEEFMFDPEFPEETYNDVWREVAEHSMADEASPFVNGAVAGRIIYEQLDLIKGNHKSVEDGLRSTVRQINEEIQKTIARDPVLRKRYHELTNGKAPS